MFWENRTLFFLQTSKQGNSYEKTTWTPIEVGHSQQVARMCNYSVTSSQVEKIAVCMCIVRLYTTKWQNWRKTARANRKEEEFLCCGTLQYKIIQGLSWKSSKLCFFQCAGSPLGLECGVVSLKSSEQAFNNINLE